MNSITLTGKEVYSKLSLVAEPQPDKNGVDYHIARYNGKNFTVRGDVYSAWKAGQIAELTVSESSYLADDPENAGQKITVTGWAYDGHMTYEQVKQFTKNTNEIAVIEAEALTSIKLNESKMAKLLAEA